MNMLKHPLLSRTVNKMGKDLQTPTKDEDAEDILEDDTLEDDPTPPTPPGPGGELPPQSPADGILLKPEDQEDFKEFQEIKKVTGFTKFKESAKEAQRLKKITDEQKEALAEKELIEENPDWESLTDEERERLKRDKKREKDILELKAKDQWREDYKKLPLDIKKLIDEKGGEDAFKDYACDPARAGAELLTLARAFTFDVVKPVPTREPKPGLERKGGGGQPPKPAKEGYTAEEAERLRRTKPALYAKLVQTHRLKIVDK